jgi:Flp pilus assembly protein TadD
LDDSNFHDLLSRLAASSSTEANRAGVALWGTGCYARAVMIFELLARRQPESSTSWGNLAANYQELGRRSDAESTFRKTLILHPMNDVVRGL